MHRPGPSPYNVLLHKLMPPCPYPLTKNMYSLCSPLSVAQHLPHYYARFIKVTCQRSLNSRLRSSANINPTPSLHLDRRRQGLDSTSPPLSVIVPTMTPAPAVIPKPILSDSSLYEDYTDIFNALDDEILAMDSNVYTHLYTTADFDATGRFPVSPAGSKYPYQLVSCFKGNIHVEPMTSCTSASYISAYENTFLHWSRYGHVPSFVRLDGRRNIDRPRKVPSRREKSHISILSDRNSSSKPCGEMHPHLEESLHIHFSYSFLQVPYVILEQVDSSRRNHAKLSLTVATKPCHLRLSQPHWCSVRLSCAPNCPCRYRNSYP